MRIAKNSVVTIDYTLTDERGDVIDTSCGQTPLSYIQGGGGIIPGLEAALEGKQEGESLAVVVPPDRAYGGKDEDLIQAIPRERFDREIDDVAVGMRFPASGDDGTHMVTVVAVDGEQVTVDANHPLAGSTLNFDVTVLKVRAATGEELRRGRLDAITS